MSSSKMRSLLRLYISPSQLAFACGVGLLLGIASLQFSALWILGAVVGIGVMVVAMKRPDIALLGILVTTSTIIYEDRLPLISIGIGSLHVPDLILLELLGVIIVRGLVDRGFKIVHTPLDWPLLTFYGIALLSTFIAIFRSSLQFNEGLRAIRTVTYYLTFFVVTNLAQEDRQLRCLLGGLVFLTSVVAGAMVIQSLLGKSLVLLPGRVEVLDVQGTIYGSVTRIVPPGQSLVLVGLIIATTALVLGNFSSTTLFRFLQWGLLGLAVVLTFNRSFWVVVALALLVLVYLARGRERQRFLGWSLAVAFLVVIILLLTFNQPDSLVARLTTATLERFSTLVRAETLGEESLQGRYIEYEYALPQIMPPSLIGLGMGARYRPWDARIDWEKFDGRDYIHNGHVWILLQAGLLGYLGLAWLSVAFLVRGFKYWRLVTSPPMRATVLGFTLTYLGVLIGAVVDPIFMQWWWTPLIGIMMGINEVVLRQVVR